MRPAHIVLALAAAAAGCGDFEDPAIVLDLRVLAMTAEPPEIVTPFDPENPRDVELAPVEVCALVADPAATRGLVFEMVACGPTDSLRCDELPRPFVNVGAGTVSDPETAGAPVEMCGTVPDNAALLAVIEDAIAVEPLAGFGGVPVQVELYVRPDDGTPEDAVFASKRVVYAPQVPEERVANTNPAIDELVVTRTGGAEESAPLGRCADIEPLAVAAGEAIGLAPVETEGARENYVLPTFDGGTRAFTENLTYTWRATAGDWDDDVTGGPRDVAGNPPDLDTEWRAPTDPDVVGAGLDVAVWLIQRDERGGAAWYETCFRVTP